VAFKIEFFLAKKRFEQGASLSGEANTVRYVMQNAVLRVQIGLDRHPYPDPRELTNLDPDAGVQITIRIRLALKQFRSARPQH
jgi:hypothetical protein